MMNKQFIGVMLVMVGATGGLLAMGIELQVRLNHVEGQRDKAMDQTVEALNQTVEVRKQLRESQGQVQTLLEYAKSWKKQAQAAGGE